MNLHARNDGAAMIEALLALPALLALLLGVSLVQQLYLAKQAALSQARRCALLHAAAGCGGELPAGCEGVLDAGAPLPDEGRTSSILGATRNAYAGSTFPLLENVPVLGDALGALFGTTTLAQAQRSVRLPGPSGATRVLTGGLTLVCNERETDVFDAAQQVLSRCADLDAQHPAEPCGAR
jgi:hypothetical protein